MSAPTSASVPADHAVDVPEQKLSVSKKTRFFWPNSLEWTNVSLSINGNDILNNVSGSLLNGELACLIGPSGSGKTTLQSILAGRMNTKMKGMTSSGEVSISGAVVGPGALRSNIAYVMQDDALPSMCTPRELLQMSVSLRLGANAKDAAARSRKLLAILGLQDCADTCIGNRMVKGLSGGEKKRTAAALELITKPRLIFLDEPLSGLDSSAAYSLMETLKKFAASGCTTLCTIHQPSSEIFQCFDKMICLAKGRVCYCDPGSLVSAYMEQAGDPVPAQYNPADYILFHVQTQPQAGLESFMQSWSHWEQKHVLPQITCVRASSDDGTVAQVLLKTSCFLQLMLLARREARELVRNKAALGAHFGIHAFVIGIQAITGAGVGAKNGTPSEIKSHFGAVFILVFGSMTSNSEPTMLQILLDRPVFLREYSANMYGLVPYFLARTVVEVLVTFICAVESVLLAYFIFNLQGHFLYLVLVSMAAALMGTSLGLLVGCLVTTVEVAMGLFGLTIVPQFMFSGVVISTGLIPTWLRWLQYAFPLKYAVNIGCIVEFDGIPGKEDLFASMEINEDETWTYVGIMIGFCVVTRSIAILGLRKKAKFVY